MIRKIFPILVITFLMVSCYRETTEIMTFDESKVLSKDKMVELLSDIHLVDGVISANQRKNIKTEDFIQPYIDVILEKHAVSKEEFEESMRYYTYHIEQLDAIYDEVIIVLSKKESEILQSPGE